MRDLADVLGRILASLIGSHGSTNSACSSWALGEDCGCNRGCHGAKHVGNLQNIATHAWVFAEIHFTLEDVAGDFRFFERLLALFGQAVLNAAADFLADVGQGFRPRNGWRIGNSTLSLQLAASGLLRSLWAEQCFLGVQARLEHRRRHDGFWLAFHGPTGQTLEAQLSASWNLEWRGCNWRSKLLGHIASVRQDRLAFGPWPRGSGLSFSLLNERVLLALRAHIAHGWRAALGWWGFDVQLLLKDSPCLLLCCTFRPVDGIAFPLWGGKNE